MLAALFATAVEAERLIVGHRLFILPADPQISELIASKTKASLKASSTI